MKNNIEIYIAAHKKFNVPNNDIYIPLHVGAEGKDDLGYTLDSTGENISVKNPHFCELTGLYWIWKNSKAEYVGLVHYRRYFYKSLFNNTKKILCKDDIVNILDKKDIILSQRGYTWGSSVRGQYEKKHIKDDLDKCEKILKDKYPEYSTYFDKVLAGDHYCPFNMFICRKELLDDYCTWLFAILFELEKEIDLKNREPYNARVYGFLSERLLNVWVLKNKLKVAELPVFNNEENVIIQRVQTIVKKLMFWK